MKMMKVYFLLFVFVGYFIDLAAGNVTCAFNGNSVIVTAGDKTATITSGKWIKIGTKTFHVIAAVTGGKMEFRQSGQEAHPIFTETEFDNELNTGGAVTVEGGFSAGEAYYNLLDDYQYDVAIEQAREERALKRLQREKAKIINLKY